MTQYVQIAVPKELYDKLGLHLNQTITLTCSEDTCELDTRVDGDNSNAPDEASNEHHKLILSKKSSKDDGKLSDSSTKKHDGTFQVIHVNSVGHDPHSVLTSNVTLINSKNSSNEPSGEKGASDSSDDMPPSDFEATSCGSPASKKAKMNTGTKTSSKNEATSDEFPRNCDSCSRRFYCHATYTLHKENCNGKQGKKEYIRMCNICHRCYFTPSAYYKHSTMCVQFSRTQKFDKQKSMVTPLTASNLKPGESTSGSSTADTQGSTVVNAEAKPEKWIPVTNLQNVHKYFIVKK